MKNQRSIKDGFTLMELIFAVFLFAMVTSGVYMIFVQSAMDVKAGLSQANFVAMARMAEEKMLKYIQEGQANDPESSYLDIMRTNGGIARIYFEDMDNNPYTVENNFMRYRANLQDNDTPPETLCSHVSFLDGEMFRRPTGLSSCVLVSFHVGDGWSYQATDAYGTGRGYQGVEVRFSATPRNIQTWYSSN
jgi:prepilin-type N-terminal cleavage/methylation domain-containing protein